MQRKAKQNKHSTGKAESKAKQRKTNQKQTNQTKTKQDKAKQVKPKQTKAGKLNKSKEGWNIFSGEKKIHSVTPSPHPFLHRTRLASCKTESNPNKFINTALSMKSSVV